MAKKKAAPRPSVQTYRRFRRVTRMKSDPGNPEILFFEGDSETVTGVVENTDAKTVNVQERGWGLRLVDPDGNLMFHPNKTYATRDAAHRNGVRYIRRYRQHGNFETPSGVSGE